MSYTHISDADTAMDINVLHVSLTIIIIIIIIIIIVVVVVKWALTVRKLLHYVHSAGNVLVCSRFTGGWPKICNKTVGSYFH